jgi:hypothetical protein
MKMRSLTVSLLAGAAITLAMPPMMAQAQSAKAAPAKPASAYKAPRTVNGQPDLQGNWTNAYITPLERAASYGERKALTREEAAKLEGAAVERFVEGNAPTDPNLGAQDHTSKNCQGAGGLDCGYNSGWKDSGTRVARVDGEPRTSFITSTPNGRVPPRIGAPAGGAGRGGPGSAGRGGAGAAGGRGAPGGGAARAATEGGEGDSGPQIAGQNDNPEGRSPGERCLTSFGNSAGPVMLPLMYNNNYKIVQSKDAVAIWVEMVHDVRVVRLNDKHRTDGVRPWFGDSIGRFEGDTLVVETTNFHPMQNFRGSSANLKVTEKFTRKGPERLLYQFTVEDPTVWETPWSGEYEFGPSQGELFEYACHEGNYGLEGILAGAREEDRQRALAATGRGGRAGGTQ